MIGTNLCGEFLNRGWQVYAVHRRHEPRLPKGVQPVFLEMQEYADLRRAVPACDVGVMLAWPGTRGMQRNDEALQHWNYEQSMECVRAMLELGCTTIVTAGSQAEYGPQPSDRKTTEQSPLSPDTAYGREKKRLFESASNLCKENGARLLEPRFYSVYGPGDYEGSMVSTILQKMLKGEPCDLTECKQIWNFLHVTDAARMLARLIESKAASGAYNFGALESAPLRSYVEQMKSVACSSSELRFGTIPDRNGQVLHLNPDTTKLFSVIGIQLLVSFEQGIAGMVDCLKTQKQNAE